MGVEEVLEGLLDTRTKLGDLISTMLYLYHHMSLTAKDHRTAMVG